MLWEIMFEMLGELFSAMGEIIVSFWGLLKAIFKSKKDETEEDKKRRGEILLICSIVGLVVAVVFMFPGTRHFVFGGGGQRMIAAQGPPVVESPRNNFPMAQYTSPQLFKKMKSMVEDDDGLKRITYYYFFAPQTPPGQKLPLVVVLHDRTGMDYGAIYLRMEAVQKYFPSFLLIPQSPLGKVWDAPDRYSGQEMLRPEEVQPPPAEARSLQDVIMLTAHVTQDPRIDENRIYIVGCDDGAAGVYGAAAHFPGIFAAGVAIAGKWSYLDRGKLAKMPLLILQGAQDQVVPPVVPRTLNQMIAASGGTLSAYHEFPTVGHDCDAPGFYSAAVWKWLFSQTRTAPPPPPAVTPVEAVPAPPVGTAVPPGTAVIAP